MLPALQSFCVYSSVGITLVYLLQATTFVAALTLDIKRMNAKRSGMFFCIKHDEAKWKPNKLSQIEFGKLAFQKLGKVLTTKIGKVSTPMQMSKKRSGQECNLSFVADICQIVNAVFSLLNCSAISLFDIK